MMSEPIATESPKPRARDDTRTFKTNAKRRHKPLHAMELPWRTFVRKAGDTNGLRATLR